MLRRILLACPLLLLSLFLTASPAAAAWPNDPNAGNVAIATGAGDQGNPVSTSDGAGGAIIAWRDTRSGTGDVYVQRINAAGAVMWLTNGVLVCGATNNQLTPKIVSDGAGGAIIVWYDLRGGVSYDIYAQRVNASGLVLWTANGVSVCTSANNQLYPVLTADGAGGAIITWYDLRSGTTYDIYAQRLNSAGVAQWTANGVVVSTAANDQITPAITTDGGNGAIITWIDTRSAVDEDVYAQKLNSAGVAQWTANGIALCTAADNQYELVVTSDGAGGAIAAWDDYRGGLNSDVYAQRVSATGTVAWSANGVAVCTAADDQAAPAITTDGSGGAVIAWYDQRAGVESDVYAQRINTAGTPQWTANGLAVCVTSGNQSGIAVTPDGLGGAIIAWYDGRNTTQFDVFAQRVGSNGVVQWTSNGVALCTAASNQTQAQLVSDGAGGAVAVWQDVRNLSNADLYAQRIERFGKLGNPEPLITSAKDVPNDQGGRLKLSWNASYLDADPTYGVFEYRVWRSVPQAALLAGRSGARRERTTDPDDAVENGRLLVDPLSALDYAWEYVSTTPAAISERYSVVVSLEGDSVGGSNPRTAFRVEARASSSFSSDRWFSAADSGYSVDNLAPTAPAPLTGQYALGSTTLHWNRNVEGDLAGYRLYRGSSVSFVPGPSNFVAQLPDTGAADAAGAPYVYKLTAVDTHGNESPVATLIPGGTLGVGDGPARAALSFAAPSPNPARGVTTLRYSLSHAGPVKLALFDAAGRRVATLADGVMQAGEHSATFALRDDAGHELAAGLYLARLEAEGRTLTRRVAAVR